jgi:predicted restriction endonuclease
LDAALFEYMQSDLVVDELKEALEGNFTECISNQVSAPKQDYQNPNGMIQDALFSDIQAVMGDPSLTSTEKNILINSRLGQDQFRSKLLKLWQGCSVTGYPAQSMLIASHIKPWRDSNNQERLDKFNGLLLLPSLDKAFDQGFISFDTSGQVLISSSLERPSLLGIKKSMVIRLFKPHHNYLAYHRSEVFKG